MFRPNKMLVTGEIQVTLSNGHTVPARIVMNEEGEVTLSFNDPKMVGQWLRTTLDQHLIGLRIVTLTDAPVRGLTPTEDERPAHIREGEDYLIERDGEVVWVHNCPVLEATVTLPRETTTCPNCGQIQITRRPA